MILKELNIKIQITKELVGRFHEPYAFGTLNWIWLVAQKPIYE
jgi:hypothetical protein